MEKTKLYSVERLGNQNYISIRPKSTKSHFFLRIENYELH